MEQVVKPSTKCNHAYESVPCAECQVHDDNTLIGMESMAIVVDVEENCPTDDFFSGRTDLIAVFDHDYDLMKLRNFRMSLPSWLLWYLFFIIVFPSTPAMFPLFLALAWLLPNAVCYVYENTSFGSTLEKLLCIRLPSVMHTALTHGGIRIAHESVTASDTDFTLFIPYSDVETITTGVDVYASTVLNCALPTLNYIVKGIPSNASMMQKSKRFVLLGLKEPYIFERQVLLMKNNQDHETIVNCLLESDNDSTPAVTTEICEPEHVV